jgi:hypothetical protein
MSEERNPDETADAEREHAETRADEIGDLEVGPEDAKEVTGGGIPGETTQEGHQSWIE